MLDLFSKLYKNSCDNCTKCHDLVQSRTQIVYPTIKSNANLLVIGEAPGHDEDIQGEGFVGTAGKTLARVLDKYRIKSYSKANICRCRPPNNRKPTTVEINNCLPYLAELIRELKPKVILLVGGVPTQLFYGKGNLYDKITQMGQDFKSSKCLESAHSILKPVLINVNYIVPAPHTSPLAFNRNAPNGVKWSSIFEEQIKYITNLSLFSA